MKLRWAHFCEEFDRDTWTIRRITLGFHVGADGYIVFPEPSYLALLLEADPGESSPQKIRVTLKDGWGKQYMSPFEELIPTFEVHPKHPRIAPVRLKLQGEWKLPGNMGHFTFNIQADRQRLGRVPLYMIRGVV